MNINGLPVYKWEISTTDEEDGVSVMSIVDDPAVEKNFMKFSTKRMKKFAVDGEKHVITGVGIRADYPIYRDDENGQYYCIFDVDVIEKIVYKFMKEKRNSDVNINHSDPTDGAFLFESFIMKEGHREMYPEFEDVSVGSWMVSYKIEDEKLWSHIKKGNLNGFSIEITGDLLPMNNRKHVHRSQHKEMIELYNSIIELDGNL